MGFVSKPFTAIFFLFSSWLFLPGYLLAFPLCVDSRAPLTLKAPLKFCSYNGNACCNTTQDSELQNQFQAMNISDSDCASIVKSIFCSRCDPFSAELFTISSSPRKNPVLCNSTVSATSSQSDQAQGNYCIKVWDSCQDVPILNSPFATALQGQSKSPAKSNSSKIKDMWAAKADFCDTFGGASTSGSSCLAGEPVTLNNSESIPPSPFGLCIEKIGNGSYLDMAGHSDNRAFFASQAGKIFLATIPEQGSGGILELDESSPFLDLSDQVHFDSQFGLVGIAVHPKFNENGRFFVSFNCDKGQWPGCSARCSCNSDNACDPSKLPSDDGAQPCQYSSVIAEYAADDSTQPSMAKTAKPTEVRRIFTMGLPFTSHHAGQILFGPDDGFLYFMVGDGGGPDGTGDPYNFAQNKKSLLGKIMRLDVDNIPTAAEARKRDLWGNYSIPKDNPYVEDKELQPEIWALGLRNPWRCSYDSERPSYFMCGDVGQNAFEEINIITKGGNYGWRVYEGTELYIPTKSPGGNTSAASINPIFPVMGYNHSVANIKAGSASISGGAYYRSLADPCMYGRFLFADLYGGPIRQGIETPEDSGNFTTSSLPFTCAVDSPIQCNWVTPGSSTPALGYVFSFGQDNSKDVFILTSNGVYRVVRPSRCKYACSKEKVTSSSTTPRPSPSYSSSLSSHYLILSYRHYMWLALLMASLALLAPVHF